MIFKILLTVEHYDEKASDPGEMPEEIYKTRVPLEFSDFSGFYRIMPFLPITDHDKHALGNAVSEVVLSNWDEEIPF